MLRASLAMVLLMVCVSSSAEEQCRWPPSQWCSSAEIAARCRVFEACMLNSWSKGEHHDAPKVSIALYYETLCPGCRQFIKEQLTYALTKVSDIMDVDLVPYGNARETQSGDSWIFHCQHGQVECEGNMIETCAMYALKDFKSYFPLIQCIEEADISSGVEDPARKCAQQLEVDYAPIDVCAKGKLGNSLQHLLALKTEKQQQQYVPWITLNGVHTEDIQQHAMFDLTQLVCNTYQGTKPPACGGGNEIIKCNKH